MFIRGILLLLQEFNANPKIKPESLLNNTVFDCLEILSRSSEMELEESAEDLLQIASLLTPPHEHFNIGDLVLHLLSKCKLSACEIIRLINQGFNMQNTNCETIKALAKGLVPNGETVLDFAILIGDNLSEKIYCTSRNSITSAEIVNQIALYLSVYIEINGPGKTADFIMQLLKGRIYDINQTVIAVIIVELSKSSITLEIDQSFITLALIVPFVSLDPNLLTIVPSWDRTYSALEINGDIMQNIDVITTYKAVMHVTGDLFWDRESFEMLFKAFVRTVHNTHDAFFNICMEKSNRKHTKALIFDQLCSFLAHDRSKLSLYATIAAVAQLACFSANHLDGIICNSCQQWQRAEPSLSLDQSHLLINVLNEIWKETLATSEMHLVLADALFRVINHSIPGKLKSNILSIKDIGAYMQYAPGDIRKSCMRWIALIIATVFPSGFDQIADLLESQDSSTVRSTIALVGEIVRESIIQHQFDLFRRLIMCLFDLLSHSNSSYRSLAYSELFELQLYAIENNVDLWSWWENDLVLWMVSNIENKPKAIISYAQLNQIDLGQLLKFNLRTILPLMIIDGKVEVIQEISFQLGLDLPTLLAKESGHILASLLMGSLDENFGGVCDSLVQMMGSDLSILQMYKLSPLDLITSLVIELGSNHDRDKKRATRALSHVERTLAGSVGPVDILQQPSFNFIFKHSLGILNILMDLLRCTKYSLDLAARIRIVKSVKYVIIRVSDGEVEALSSISTPLLGLLKFALENSDLELISLEIWSSFISKSTSSGIKPLFVQVASLFVNHFSFSTETIRPKLSKILQLLLETHHTSCADLFSQIPRFPEEWKCLTDLIQKFLPKSINIWTTFEGLIKNLHQENLIVISGTLDTLKVLLVENHIQILNSLEEETVNTTITSMIHGLLKTCCKYQVSQPQFSRICSECIGIIGAVDPARLGVLEPLERPFLDGVDLMVESDAMDFITSLIEHHLAPAFINSHDSDKQVRLAYAIQEFLKICGITAKAVDGSMQHTTKKYKPMEMDRSTKSRVSRWDHFSKKTVAAITPLLSSKYFLSKDQNEIVPPSVEPLYNNSASYEGWFRSWATVLIKSIKKTFHMQPILNVLLVLNDDDINLTRIFLPHVFLIVILENDSVVVHRALNECLVVLMSENVALPREKHHSSLQIIFDLVEHLSKWIRVKKIQQAKLRVISSRSRLQGQKDKGKSEFEAISLVITNVESFISKIPQIIMSEASFYSTDYARSLMHYENHVRIELTSKNEIEMQPHYQRIQQLFANLGDYDAIDGLFSKFITPTLDEKIIHHESLGQWSIAYTCYELKLQKDHSNIENQVGLLTCLQSMGHYGSFNLKLRNSSDSCERPNRQIFIVESTSSSICS